MFFRQGEQHDGIYLIESTRTVFYTAPAGQEITLGHWMAGNFCGGPTSSPKIRRPPRGAGRDAEKTANCFADATSIYCFAAGL